MSQDVLRLTIASEHIMSSRLERSRKLPTLHPVTACSKAGRATLDPTAAVNGTNSIVMPDGVANAGP